MVSVVLLWTQVFAPSLTGRAGGESSLMAQVIEDGQAFYVYRNDGDFNGFFYDRVLQMNASKFDLDSIEHEEYVVQDIVTADSIYRIPLAAIDSIGFQQPEIKFNPKLRHMDMLGMTDYIKEYRDMGATTGGAVQSLSITFNNDLPAILMPQVDDILAGFTGVLSSTGFVGRVTSVQRTDDGIFVTCEKPQQLSDVFEQLVSVEEVGEDPATHQVRRRMAGYNQVRRKASAGGGSVTLADLSINGHLTPIPDNNAGIFLGLDLGASLKIRLMTVYQIRGNILFSKLMTTEEYSVSAAATFSLSGSGSKSLGEITHMPRGIMFPAALPIFSIRPLPDLAFRWKGEVKASLTFPVVSGTMKQTYTIDKDAPYFITYHGSESAQSTPTDIFGDLGAEVQFNGFVQLGVKAQFGIFTASWLDLIFDAGVSTDLYIGPKIEGSVSINLKDLAQGDGAYALHNSNFTLSPVDVDYESYGEATGLILGKTSKWTFIDGSFKLLQAHQFFMFPQFENFYANHNNELFMLNTSWETNKVNVFWKSSQGFAICNPKGDIVKQQYLSELSFGSTSPESAETSFGTKNIKPGKYYAAPLLRAFGTDYPVYSMQKPFNVPIYLKVPEQKITASGEGGKLTIPVETNADTKGTEVVNLDNAGLGGREVVHQVTASVDDNSAFPVSKNVYIEQSGSGSGYNRISIGASEGLMSYGYCEYDDDGMIRDLSGVPCNVSASSSSVSVSGSWSGGNTSTQSPFLTVTNSDDEGNWWFVPVTDSYGGNFSFRADLIGEVDREELGTTMSYLSDMAQKDIQDILKKEDLVASVSIYFRIAAFGEEVTPETGQWTTSPESLTSQATLEKKHIWQYKHRVFKDGSESNETPVDVGIVPILRKITDGKFYSHVKATGGGYSMDREITFTVIEGTFSQNGSTWYGSGKASSHIKEGNSSPLDPYQSWGYDQEITFGFTLPMGSE